MIEPRKTGISVWVEGYLALQAAAAVEAERDLAVARAEAAEAERDYWRDHCQMYIDAVNKFNERFAPTRK